MKPRACDHVYISSKCYVKINTRTLPDSSYHSPLRPVHMAAGSASFRLFQSAVK